MNKKESVIRIAEKFATFHDRWSPKVIAQFNNLHIKLVKLQGEFVWHTHNDTDELFIVHKGQLIIRYRDQDVILKPGELHVVPKGVEHITLADEECEVMLIEPAGTINTGNTAGDKTILSESWI